MQSAHKMKKVLGAEDDDEDEHNSAAIAMTRVYEKVEMSSKCDKGIC